MINEKELTVELQVSDFAKAFGINKEVMPNICVQDIKDMNTSIFPIVGEEYKNLILQILKKTKEDMQKVGSDYRKNVWFNGWEENLSKYKNNKSNGDLKPKFLRDNQPIRWNQNYYHTSSPDFEKRFQEILAKYLFFTYMKDFKNIYEFGPLMKSCSRITMFT